MQQSKDTITLLLRAFKESFPSSAEPLIIRSPGRINIIGEHTDYNDGFVLPAAIDKAAYLAISLRDDNEIHLRALDLQRSFTVAINNLKPVTNINWPNYILGVVNEFRTKNIPLQGFNAVLTSDVPIGAGLSSSAAVECATAFALNELLHTNIDKIELVKMAQSAEHTYAGVRCGIMDQFASMIGKKNNLIKLDCRSLEYEYIPLTLKGYKLVLFDSNVKHSLASSEYNKRLEQCEQGVHWVNKKYPAKKLRDITKPMLQEQVQPKNKLIYQRCLFVVEEIERLQQACEYLKNGNIHGLGEKMFQTHNGLSKLYEVSCKELDILVELVHNNPAVLGARMMGGGFGGCTLNIVKDEAIILLIESVSKSYKQATGLECKAYIVEIEDGTTITHPNRRLYV